VAISGSRSKNVIGKLKCVIGPGGGAPAGGVMPMGLTWADGRQLHGSQSGPGVEGARKKRWRIALRHRSPTEPVLWESTGWLRTGTRCAERSAIRHNLPTVWREGSSPPDTHRLLHQIRCLLISPPPRSESHMSERGGCDTRCWRSQHFFHGSTGSSPCPFSGRTRTSRRQPVMASPIGEDSLKMR
jgi:hypothetical protein